MHVFRVLNKIWRVNAFCITGWAESFQANIFESGTIYNRTKSEAIRRNKTFQTIQCSYSEKKTSHIRFQYRVIVHVCKLRHLTYPFSLRKFAMYAKDKMKLTLSVKLSFNLKQTKHFIKIHKGNIARDDVINSIKRRRVKNEKVIFE